MAKRWTEEERRAWAVFVEGRLMFPPGDRTLTAVVDRLRGSEKGKRPDLMPWIGSLSTQTMHAASMAALATLRHLPHRRANQLKDYVDVVVLFAVGDLSAFFNGSTEAKTRLETLQSIFNDDAHRAILAARKAIADASAKQGLTVQGIAA